MALIGPQKDDYDIESKGMYEIVVTYFLKLNNWLMLHLSKRMNWNYQLYIFVN
jgi:hypothetical protein